MTTEKALELIRLATTPLAKALIAIAWLAEQEGDGRKIADAVWS